MVVKGSYGHLQTVEEAEVVLQAKNRVKTRMVEFRKKYGKSATDLNRLMSLTYKEAWTRIERSSPPNLTLRTLARVAAIMGLEVWELLAPLPGEENHSSSGT